jgi:hypothetical protein
MLWVMNCLQPALHDIQGKFARSDSDMAQTERPPGQLEKDYVQLDVVLDD